MRIIALLILVLPLQAFAQTVPPDAAQNPETVVVTATRVPTPTANIAAGITVIDRATIEQRGYTDLVQALSAVPGLRIAQSGGPGGQSSVFIRGTNSNQVLVLRDGVPINDPGDPSDAFNFGIDTLNDIDRIEIIRGPMSSLYGSGAIGGVINLITRTPENGLHGSLTLAGGSQTTGLAQGNVNGRSGIWDFAATAEAFSTRGFDQTPPRETAVYTGEVDGDREKLGTIEVGVTPVAGTRVSLLLRGRDSTYGYDEQGFFTYDGGNATGYDATDSARLGVLSHLFDGAWTTGLTVSGLQDDRRYTVTYTPLDPNDDTEDDRYHGRSAFVQWSNTVQLPDWGFTDQSVLTGGAGYNADKADTSINSVSGGFPYDSLTRAHDEVFDGYAGIQTRLWKRLTTTAQIREDSTSDSGDALTWRLGGVFDVSEIATRLKASYGTGFRAPALFDRYGVDSYGYMGNPNLRPERSQGWEAGFETDLPLAADIGSATVSVTYFDNRIHDLIQLQYTPVYTSVNIDSARAKGIEAVLTVRASHYVAADISYTYTDARDLATNSLLLRRPFNQGAADLRITPIPALTITPEVTYTGGFDDYLVNDFGEGTSVGLAKSGTIVNLNVAYQATPKIQLFAWGKNIADSKFEPVSGYITPGASVLVGTKLTY
jgi:vitamin B12 transporter